MFKALRMWLLHLRKEGRGYTPTMFHRFLLQEHVLVESLVNHDHIMNEEPRISDAATRSLFRVASSTGRCYSQRYFDRISQEFEPPFPKVIPVASRLCKLDHYTLLAVRHDLFYTAGKFKLAVPRTLLDVENLPTKFDSDYIRPNKELCDAIHPDMWAILRP